MDGGGVRTIASIHFLQKLEQALGEKLCQKFDYFIGTSAGAISCLSLAVKQCEAKELGEVWSSQNLEKTMTNSSWETKLGLLQSNPKYTNKGKRDVLESFYDHSVMGDALKPVSVMSYDIEKREPVLIKSYSKQDKDISLIDAADASTAAPIYYSTVKIGSRYLIDGAIVANHPVLHGFVEAKKIYPEDRLKVLSVGTGLNKKPLNGEDSKGWGIVGWVTHDLFNLMMESSLDHELAADLIGGDYLRINSELGDINSQLDDNSDENIEKIIAMGGDWWKEFGSQTLRLLQE
jgi:uncharacterized protein